MYTPNDMLDYTLYNIILYSPSLFISKLHEIVMINYTLT
jgi:hypothetical protein